MSEEVKPTGIGLTISNINHDMMVRKLQSERQARLDAETKLRELQDAMALFDLKDKNRRLFSDSLFREWRDDNKEDLDQAQSICETNIQESRIRNANEPRNLL